MRQVLDKFAPNFAQIRGIRACKGHYVAETYVIFGDASVPWTAPPAPTAARRGNREQPL